ncbi:MAG: YfcE family phosphodiesterase [Clostridia bacterium]|nr:YfcE family phosphodiesterase [Clostridia bacterium]
MISRLVVVSDTHGNRRLLETVIKQQSTAKLLVHLGDGANDMQAMLPWCSVPVVQVAGNCDWSSLLPDEELLRFAETLLLAVHGHKYDVKSGLLKLSATARRRNAKVALFGHTHQPLTRYEDGLYLVNPGSLGHGGTYAVIDFENGGICPTIISCR